MLIAVSVKVLSFRILDYCRTALAPYFVYLLIVKGTLSSLDPQASPHIPRPLENLVHTLHVAPETRITLTLHLKRDQDITLNDILYYY